jgi:general secretion pathway protein L
MLAGFASWWIARITELLPPSWTRGASGVPDGIVVESDHDNTVSLWTRHAGQQEPVTLGVAARLAARKTVVVRAPPACTLQKLHVVPTAPRPELTEMLRFELGRITPFKAEDLFWRWDGRPRPGDRTRTDVTLTMVPKTALVSVLDTLSGAGIRPRFVETETNILLEIDDTPRRSAGYGLLRGLFWVCATLAIVAVALPVLLQELALRDVNNAIDDMQPSIRQVEDLRRNLTADSAGRDVLAQEMQRTGDLLQVLATITRILPDDTYLTDFSLHDRQMTLAGRSAAAARLITSLSADPAIRNAGFAAPVTRIEGATTDVFSIRADIAP